MAAPYLEAPFTRIVRTLLAEAIVRLIGGPSEDAADGASAVIGAAVELLVSVELDMRSPQLVMMSSPRIRTIPQGCTVYL